MLTLIFDSDFDPDFDFEVLLLQQSWRHPEAPSKGVDKLFGFDLPPFVTRRASQKGAEPRAVLFERSEFHSSPPALRSTG